MRKLSLVLVVLVLASAAMASYSSPQVANSGTWSLYNFDSYDLEWDGVVYMHYDQVGNPYGAANTDLYCRQGYDETDPQCEPQWGLPLVQSMDGFGMACQYDGLTTHQMTRGTWTSDSSVNIDLWANVDSSVSSAQAGKKWLFQIQGVFRMFFDYLDGDTVRLNVISYTNSGAGVPTLRVVVPKDEWLHYNASFLDGVVSVEVLDTEGARVGGLSYDTNGEELKQITTKYWIGSNGDNVHVENFMGMIDDIHVSSVPEPATIALLGLGGLLLRRKNS